MPPARAWRAGCAARGGATGSRRDGRVPRPCARPRTWPAVRPQPAARRAAQQASSPATDDVNTGDNDGVGYFEVNQKNGWRWSTAKAFLRPTCFARPNFEMWTGAQVCKLVIERQDDGSQRCTGVEVWTGEE